jgi:hypothetical protein
LSKSIGAAAVSGLALPATRAVADSPSERVSIAVIGFNGIGGGHIRRLVVGKKDEKGPGMSQATARAKDHMANFLDSVRTREPPRAPADVAHLTCGLVHLGEIAYRLERVLHFDPDREKFQNDTEADALLGKSYRSPWDVPDVI